MDEDEREGRRRSVLPWLIGGLAVPGVVLVIAGRLLDSGRFPGWQDPIYSVLLAFSIDGTFLTTQNPLTPLGALLIALALYTALLGGLFVLLRARITAFRARRARGHVAVIGEGAGSAAIARYLAPEQKVVLIGAADPEERNILTVERPRDMAALAAAGNLTAARTVVLNLPEDQDNAALALALSALRKGDAPVIRARIADRILADRVANEVGGAGRIEIFAEAPQIARDLFIRHPAHAAADRMGASRVHLVVMGFGRLGEAIAEEAVFSGLVDGLGVPMLTIIDRDANGLEQHYRAAHPALDLAADFAFIEADPLELAGSSTIESPALAALRARDDMARITGLALCLSTDADNVRLALGLQGLRRREGRFFAPAFIRARDTHAVRLVRGPEGDKVTDPRSGAIPMETASRLVATDVLDRAGRDRAARTLHEAYRAREGGPASAVSEWNTIPETFRRSNRHGADHLGAKLFSLGLTSEADPHMPIALGAATHGAQVAPLLAGTPAAGLDALAHLERRRWVAERVLDGWVPGAPRDDDRRVHPLLIGGTDAPLSDADRIKDHDQVRVLLSALGPTSGRGSALLETRVGLAGHRNLAADVEKQAAAAAATQLAAMFGPADAVTLVTPLAPGADIALAEAASAGLAGRVGELRLIVVEAVPYATVLDVAAAEMAGDETGRAAFIAAMLARRKALFQRFARVDIVKTGVPGVSEDTHRRDKVVFETALRRANAYLARRTDLMVLLWDGKEAAGPGGTGELARWIESAGDIPPEIDFLPRLYRAGKERADIVIGVQRAPL